MRWLLLFTLGGSVAQTNVVQMLSVAGATPDLPFMMTVFWALRRGPEAGCVAGFFAGLLQDVGAGGLVGVQALTKALAGFTLGLVGGRLSVANPLVQVPGLVLLTVAEGLLRFGLLQLFHYPASLSCAARGRDPPAGAVQRCPRRRLSGGHDRRGSGARADRSGARRGDDRPAPWRADRGPGGTHGASASSASP